jgi:type I restriction enzyme, R subunit
VPPPKLLPEQQAREQIDAALGLAGWKVPDRADLNLSAARGVAVRELPMKRGHGTSDYVLFVDGKAVGALEAKKAGTTLRSVEPQANKYSEGLPPELDAPWRPLPFMYVSTGVETLFWNRFDPFPRSRGVFAVHRPETLAEWLASDPYVPSPSTRVPPAGADGGGVLRVAEPSPRPSTLRSRLRAMPPLDGTEELWPNQIRAIANLEDSFKNDRPRALIQMATGSGKSLTAVASIYRLVKFAQARRVLFLVDRTNLGEQAETEFERYRTYDDHRKLTELYTVQRMTGNKVRSASKVVITTIQRLYSMLRGEAELDPDAEEGSQFDDRGRVLARPVEVAYNPALPPEFFDVVFVDECHRSIYTLWRQVLEYFDAYVVGLTATPAKHTFGFFNRNLVMEYDHDRAVADGVNVDFDIYRIRTRITEQGSTVEAKPGVVLGKRERRTRRMRWEQPDEDVTYTAKQLDRDVVAKDQIRTIVRTFRERLFTEIFPDRTQVPKTLIFTKDDSHAEDVVDIVRQEFGRGNDFCQKITYKVTGQSPKDLIQEFRTSYMPRIAVTVDMIATGTDVRPIEIVMFLRSVKSRVLYEQMKGRGVRVVQPDELKSVTPDAEAKTRFVLVDCVGVTESPMQDTQPLERNPGVSFGKLLEHVALGGTKTDLVSSLASRLARLARACGPNEHRRIERESSGVPVEHIAREIVDALDADVQADHARRAHGLDADAEPTSAQLDEATAELVKQAVEPLATRPKLRQLLLEVKQELDQIIDEVSRDDLIEAGASPEAKERAKELVASFEQYLAEHRDEIEALQIFYAQPYRRRLRYADIQALADAIQAPPRQWTPERLWRAYEQLDQSKVRGASAGRLLTDVVSLVRFALHQDGELEPYADKVYARFDNWLAQQENRGRKFSPEQLRWLEMVRDHVAQSLEMQLDDFDYTPFVEEGGLGKATQVFGPELAKVLDELNEVLTA